MRWTLWTTHSTRFDGLMDAFDNNAIDLFDDAIDLFDNDAIDLFDNDAIDLFDNAMGRFWRWTRLTTVPKCNRTMFLTMQSTRFVMSQWCNDVLWRATMVLASSMARFMKTKHTHVFDTFDSFDDALFGCSKWYFKKYYLFFSQNGCRFIDLERSTIKIKPSHMQQTSNHASFLRHLFTSLSVNNKHCHSLAETSKWIA